MEFFLIAVLVLGIFWLGYYCGKKGVLEKLAEGVPRDNLVMGDYITIYAFQGKIIMVGKEVDDVKLIPNTTERA